MKTIFTDQKTFDKLYEECLENAPMAPEEVKTAYNNMHDAFEEHIIALGEYWFRHFYQCGYEAAMKEIKQER